MFKSLMFFAVSAFTCAIFAPASATPTKTLAPQTDVPTIQVADATNAPIVPDNCEYWVAPSPAGNDGNPGTFKLPWATLEHAAENIVDENCIVWFKSGTYTGRNRVGRRFTGTVTFKSVEPYAAILQDNGSPLVVRGARNIIFEGFEFRHIDPDASIYVVQVSRDDDLWAEEIIFRNNVFHESYNNDLLKIHNGSRFITVEGNVFYNQGASDQHMDVNSVTDVIIQDNIFFNDFAGSGRPDNKDTKHFIVIKDSNEGSDGLLGSKRVIVRRNIFLNWEGGNETFVKTGNDGKPYHEAENVLVENNLFVGNSEKLIGAAFGVRGAKNITFANNTIVGDLPSKAYAFRVTTTDSNPKNEDIRFVNNIWSDDTGTMGAELPGETNEFSDGDPAQTINLILNNNLYWNGGNEIPSGDLVSPLVDDANRVIGNPLLNYDHDNVVLPRWNGHSFTSGNQTIRQEFVRLAEHYCKIPADSPAVGVADPAYTPADDILGQSRSIPSALGACEQKIQLSGFGDISTIWLWWTPADVLDATSLAIRVITQFSDELITGIPATETAYTLTDLLPYTIYGIRLLALGGAGEILAQSNQLLILTTDLHIYMPIINN